jgi:hypothetical protein
MSTRTRGLFLRRGCLRDHVPAAVRNVRERQNERRVLDDRHVCRFRVGFMLPKLYVQRRAAARRQSVIDELPLFVDMLRLLQGVGLSLDRACRW